MMASGRLSNSFNIKLKYFISSYERKEAINSEERNTFNLDMNTKYYMAPEILENPGDNSDDPNAAFAANMWSLGVITYRLLTGNQFPFEGNNVEKIKENINKEEILIPERLCPSYEIINFITSLLRKEPKVRPTLKKIMSEEFITKKPENFDYINIKLLCKNERYLKLDLKSTYPIFEHLLETTLEKRLITLISKEKVKEILSEIEEKKQILNKNIEELDKQFKNIKNPIKDESTLYTKKIRERSK